MPNRPTEPQDPDTDAGKPQIVRDIEAAMETVRTARMVPELDVHGYPPVHPDDPLVAKLKETFSQPERRPHAAYGVGAGVAIAQAMIGIPIELACRHLNLRYLTEITNAVRLRRTVPEWGDDADWNLLAPPYLLHGRGEVDGVKLLHSLMCPDWSFLLIRSPEWHQGQLRRDLSIAPVSSIFPQKGRLF